MAYPEGCGRTMLEVEGTCGSEFYCFECAPVLDLIAGELSAPGTFINVEEAFDEHTCSRPSAEGTARLCSNAAKYREELRGAMAEIELLDARVKSLEERWEVASDDCPNCSSDPMWNDD